jgi:hypothetical protein
MMVFRYEYENATVLADGNTKARKRFLGQDGSFEDQFENQFSNKPAWENRAGWDLASFL